MYRNSMAASAVVLGLLSNGAWGQVVDPGVRGGAPGAGGVVLNLDPLVTRFWFAAQDVFEKVFTTARGLGPRFNGNSCLMCHSQPASGGSSPAENPLPAMIASGVAPAQMNVLPPFISPTGPILEARFVNLPNGAPDGSVHSLFVTSPLNGCNIRQPNFAAALAANNVSFRIPTPTFGLGFVEMLTEQQLITASKNISGPQAAAGIVSGFFNRSDNDGTIARFGWKAQNKSLLLFSGEALNVEMGVTNDLFTTERTGTPDDQLSISQSCNLNPIPEDTMQMADLGPSTSLVSNISSAAENFVGFMRFNAVPEPAPATNQSVQGRNQFVNVGCALCHIPQHTTGQTPFGPAMSNVTISPYSDFALHDMGTGLQDRVKQGLATGRHFRTAPLWGVGQRVFFLHDGRTTDLLAAIRAHASTGSEANTVVGRFNALSPSDQQAVLVFLRSL